MKPNPFVVIVYMLLLSSLAQAQLSAVGYKSSEYLKFKASKTYAVKIGHRLYDEELQSAMKDYWKITPYQVISQEEMKELLKDKTASFLVPVVIRNEMGQEYHYITLLNGGKKSLFNYTYSDMIAYGIINHFGNEENSARCAPRLRNILASMVNAMNYVEKNEINGNTKKMAFSLLDYYKTLSYKIKDRILLFNMDAMGSKLTESEIAELYPYKYEICDQDKINQVIKEKDSKYYYFQPAITLNKAMFVFDPVTGEVLFGEAQMMGLNINKWNIKDLVKAIETGK